MSAPRVFALLTLLGWTVMAVSEWQAFVGVVRVVVGWGGILVVGAVMLSVIIALMPVRRKRLPSANKNNLDISRGQQ